MNWYSTVVGWVAREVLIIYGHNSTCTIFLNTLKALDVIKLNIAHWLHFDDCRILYGASALAQSFHSFS